MKYLFKFIKPFIFGFLILFYVSALKGILEVTRVLFQSEFPYKTVVFFGLLVYLIYLVNLYLAPKIYFEKSVVNSIIWASIFNMIFLILFAYGMNKAFNSNMYIINLDLEDSFNSILTELKYKGKITKNDYNDFRKVVSLSIYGISFLVIINLISSIVIYKKYKSKPKY